MDLFTKQCLKNGCVVFMLMLKTQSGLGSEICNYFSN